MTYCVLISAPDAEKSDHPVPPLIFFVSEKQTTDKHISIVLNRTLGRSGCHEKHNNPSQVCRE